MSCKYCEHCKDIEKQKDYKKRKSYVENSRINMYIPQHHSNGMTIKEAEEYLSQIHGHDYWYTKHQMGKLRDGEHYNLRDGKIYIIVDGKYVKTNRKYKTRR